MSTAEYPATLLPPEYQSTTYMPPRGVVGPPGERMHTVVYTTGEIDAHSPHPQCPKCGALMDGLSYEERVRWTSSGCMDRGCVREFDDDAEHLHRWCSTCHYGVWERCLDDPEREGDA